MNVLALLLIGQLYGTAEQFSQKSWTAKDKAFREIRARYEASTENEWLTEVKRVQKLMEASTNLNADLVYRYMTLSYAGPHSMKVDRRKAITSSPAFRKGINFVHEKPLPNSFEFTRAALFYFVRYDFPHRSYLPVARKLSEKAPSDIWLNYIRLTLLQPQTNPEHRSEGIKLISKLDADRQRNDTQWDYSIGVFYYLCWQKSKSASDRSAALSRFDAYTSKPMPPRRKESVNELRRRLG